MTHSARPTPLRRLPLYPVRESDGEGYVGTMLDLRQLRITEARDSALANLELAKDARSRGDSSTWAARMAYTAMERKRFAGLLRSGGRVNWRGEPL